VTPDTITVDGTTYVRAYPVAGNRCVHCGGRPPWWTPGRIIAALHAHAAVHGTGPKQAAWAAYTPEHPAFEAVRRVFGSWRNGLKAADVRPGGGRHMWTAELIIERILDWHIANGQAPRVNDWRLAGAMWPSEATVRKHFGTWNEAMVAAGVPPTTKGSRYTQRPLPRTGARLSVDAAPVVAAVRDYLGPDGSGAEFARTIGVDPKRIHMLLRGDRPRMTHGSADEILMAIGRPDVMAVLEVAA
jgi:hypothetical protein